MAKNWIKGALEADFQQKIIFEANPIEVVTEKEDGENHASKLVEKEHSTVVEGEKSESQRLDYVYDDEPLRFEKDP